MTSPAGDNALGDFLHASRARVTPEQAGLALYGDRRRVSGLRREELAMLAGVSSSYYTRLEQGQSRNASAQVLDALASVLQLDDTGRTHLHRLAKADTRRVPRRRAAVENVDPALLELLGALGDVPALITGRRNDVLAWNPLGHALLAGHLDVDAPRSPATRPNMTKLVFLDAETRALYMDWNSKSRAVVGNLRLTAGEHPEDTALAELIGALAMTSAVFAALWADHRVQACSTATYALRHPLVGAITVTQQALNPGGSLGQTLITNTVPPGSSSAEALALLTQLVGPVRSHRETIGDTMTEAATS